MTENRRDSLTKSAIYKVLRYRSIAVLATGYENPMQQEALTSASWVGLRSK